ncbi:MAG: DUF4838 domain-containing protein [Clostridia bacterium]|nr:DUF4838 domain-containing protein [Clostridia bacterium]
MKKTNKFISLLLGVCSVSAVFVSCAEAAEEAETQSEVDVWTGRGIHTATVSETDEYIVKNGTTDYVLLLPEQPKEYEIYAADLINEYMQLSLGVQFPVAYSTGEEDASDGKFISIGDTALMRASGVSVSQEKFGMAGFKLFTRGDDVYATGSRKGIRYGTYYAAQEFLRYAMDWEVYSYDEIQYDILKDLKLYDFDVVEIPEFETRGLRTRKLQENPEYRRLLRLEIEDEYSLPFGASHSHLKILTYEKYGGLHPEWFVQEADDKTGEMKVHALCLANEEMTSAFVDELVGWFERYPEINFAHLGIMDTAVYCKCEACEKWRTDNNTGTSGQMVDFTNRVCRLTNERIKKLDSARSVELQMFAYSHCTEPPVHAENGEWVADSPLCIPDENVYVWYAPIYANWSEAITSAPNATFKEYLDGWSVLCTHGNLNIWQYNTNFNHILSLHKNFDIESTSLRAYSDAGATRMYMQGQGNVFQAGLIEMRNYVHAKLMWNPNLNYNDLANEFIQHYYGPAADDIAEMFYKQTSYYEYLRSRTPSEETPRLSGGLRVNLVDTKYWSFGYVDNIKNIMEHAYESIKPLESKDKKAYNKYYWRVGSAYMENLFLQLELYRTVYGKEYTYYAIDLMSSIAENYGYTTTQEREASGLLVNYYKKWRATYA